MQLQTKLREPLAKISEEPFRVSQMLEPGDEVVRETHDDHIPVRAATPPPLGPEVEDVVEIDVSADFRAVGSGKGQANS
jgi:hypothetical protein